MSSIPKIVPVNLATSLKMASKAHADVKTLIAQHAATVAQGRKAAHDKLAAENQLTEGMRT